MDFKLCADCYCLASRRQAREITRIYDSYLRPHGLRATQFSVLAALAITDAAPMGKLAHALGLERTTLSRSTALLQRRGWIRPGTGNDARVRPLRLTALGRKKLESAYAGWKAAQGAVQKKFRLDKIL